MFNPDIHSKQYLKNNHNVLKQLAENSKEFLHSPLAFDKDLLEITFGDDDELITLAHLLAKKSLWARSSAAQNIEILKLQNGAGRTVAHILAETSNEWAQSKAAKNIEVLTLVDDFTDETVAGCLASNSSKWVSQLSIDDIEILKLKTYVTSPDIVAEELVSSSLANLSVDLVSDLRFLSIEIEKPSLGGFNKLSSTIAHAIAEKDVLVGAFFEIMQRNEVLKLKESNGLSVAHFLAENSQIWYSTPAASRDEILRLSLNDGTTVAHKLAIYHGDNCPKAVWSQDYLTLSRNSSTYLGITVAHDLASCSSEWVSNCEHAFSKDVLAMTSVHGNNSSIKLSVAENLIGKSLSEIVLRVMQVGGSFKFHTRYSPLAKISKEDINDIEKQTDLLLESQSDLLVKLKINLSIFSTLINFKSVLIDQIGELNTKSESLESCDLFINRKHSEIEDLIKEKPELLDSRLMFKDENLTPGLNLLDQINSRRTFSEIQVSLSESEKNSNPSNKLF